MNRRTLGPALAAVTGLTLALMGSPARANCPPAIFWPDPQWPEAVTTGPAVDALDDYAFTLDGPDEERRGVRSDGVVLVHRGRIIYERYGRGFEAHHPHLTWSVSKSMLDATLGAAVHQGYLTIDDSVCDYYDQADACDITPRDLLNMGSGLEWNEGYEDEPYYLSSVIAMLYGFGALDMAAFVGGHPSEFAPGTVFRYSSGDSVLLAAVLAGALPGSMHDSFPWDLVFDPIGMRSVVFEQDRAGTFVGGSYAYATPREMARLGYLYLHDGCWAQQRILPEGWVADSTGVNEVFTMQTSEDWERGSRVVPGRHWWTNAAIPSLGIDSAWPDVPADTYAALGHWGQSISVIPSEHLVVVRTADDRDDVFEDNRFLSLAVAVAQEAE